MTALWALALSCASPPPSDGLTIHIVEQPAPVDSGTPGTSPDTSTDTSPPPDTDTAIAIADLDPPQLRINEVMLRNDSILARDDGSYADWFELYNADDEVVDLGDVTVDDGGGDAWTGTGTLRPGEHLLVWADPDTEGAAPFALSEGETLALSVQGLQVDRFETGPVPSDVSLARFPDASDTVAATIWPTPGWTNGSGPGPGTDPTEVLFQTDQVWDLQLQIPADSWTSLQREPYTEVPASFYALGASFPQVNVRIKGVWGSLRTLDQKAAFKVDLGDYEDRSLRGVDDLTLNNMVQDPTYVAELITYSLFREAGLPAPRVGYVRLFVNDELFGLYALVETPDEEFLDNWYADPSGPLFEGAYGVDFWHGQEDLFEYDEGPLPEDRSTLTELATALDASPAVPSHYADLQALFDMRQFNQVMAVEALAWHWDGYTTANNYRVYHDPSTDLFTMIPWGTDQTWTDAWYGPYDGYGRLSTWCIASPGCLEDYRAALLDMADVLQATPLEDRMDEVRAFLEPFIADSEPRGEHTPGNQASHLDAMRNSLQQGPDRIRAAAGLD